MKKVLFSLLVMVLFITRFVGLDWGLPYPMHPDERNMAVAVQQLSCPSLTAPNTCLNPHFFAYGQFPLYLAYGGIQLYHLATGVIGQPTFIEATLALRTIAALSSIALVFVLFRLVGLFIPGKKGLSFGLRLMTIVFLIFQPYAIQLSHFGTTESLLMLLYALIIYLSLSYYVTSDYRLQMRQSVSLGLLLGIALGTKSSSLLFLGVPLLVYLVKMVKSIKKKGVWIHHLYQLAFFLVMTALVFVLSSPHSFINWNDFVGSMNYESAIGLGAYIPFYTRQFVGTVPLLFQFEKILPFVLGWPILLGGVLGFFILPSSIVDTIKLFVLRVLRGKRLQQQAQRQIAAEHLDVYKHRWGKLRLKDSAILFDILRFALLLSLLPPSFFFAKWTRFVSASFPLFSVLALLFFLQIEKKNLIIAVFCLLLSIIPGLAYFSIYTSPDVRFSASNWIYANIPDRSKILSETANVIDLPIPSAKTVQPTNKYYQNSFNFYDLDHSMDLQRELSEALSGAEYIIVPSRRIFKNHMNADYPLLEDYYSNLFSGKSGFQKIAEFSSFPRIQLFGKTLVMFPDEDAEETWTVFDHPVIRIYKKTPLIAEQKDFSEYQTTKYRLLEKDYRLLVADSPEKWESGLMYVKGKQDIGGMDGMIFTFPDSLPRSFWNKNTLSNLTLYWIKNKQVLGSSDLPSITETQVVTTVTSPSNADTVIEIIR